MSNNTRAKYRTSLEKPLATAVAVAANSGTAYKLCIGGYG